MYCSHRKPPGVSERMWSVTMDVECKLRCVNFRRVSDPRRAFLPAFRVTGSAGDKSGCANAQPGSTRERWRHTWERWRHTWERRRHVWEHLESQ
jgi:hypothetical protein